MYEENRWLSSRSVPLSGANAIHPFPRTSMLYLILIIYDPVPLLFPTGLESLYPYIKDDYRIQLLYSLEY